MYPGYKLIWTRTPDGWQMHLSVA